MNFIETHELLISTLSPVHVGCGEDYEPTNYVMEGETLQAFDPATLLTQLGQRGRDELARALDAPNPLLAAQRFFYRHKPQALSVATISAPVAPAAARHYASRIGQVANQQAEGGSVINKLEIARTAFNPADGMPILPGSSLKGAIRTAVLNDLRGRRKASFPLNDRDAGNSKAASTAASNMERDLMEGSFQTDPLRLVKLADGMFQPGSYKARNPQGEEIQRERQVRTILFQANHKKRPQANHKKRPNQFASRAKIEALVECVPHSQPSAFRTSLVIERKAGRGEGTPNQQLTFAHLAAACNTFYRERFEEEIAILETNNYVSEIWLKNARTRLAESGIWGKAIAEGRGFLLRVGRHSGAESVTVDAPRKIKILGAQGQPPTWQKAATTVWLAATEPGVTKGMWPFGWVFVRTR